ncbi:hypothetical protein CMV_030047 [Castanea mollissima]|uniref:Uncharacterized protein n=1 Tax=Castanea mollissima TaxID=60419 RepID=A0A8J4UYW6_9ROSI|nr:hypothetical protein CMV_030047 [Castanea mollissima]
MLILCLHDKPKSPPSFAPPSPPATFFGPVRWVSVVNSICKATSDEKQKHGIVDPSSALEKRFKDALELSCWSS